MLGSGRAALGHWSCSQPLWTGFLDKGQRRCGLGTAEFVDDVILLDPSYKDLQHALGRFTAECEASGMRISSFKSKATVLDWKKVLCPLQVRVELLPQVEESC